MSSSCAFRLRFLLNPLPFIKVLTFVTLVGLAHALPLQPTSPSKEKRSDLVCGAASWQDVVAFFLLNYVAHAATVRHFPGDPTKTQMWYTACALFLPFSGVWRACQSIANARPFEKDPLERAKYAGALCMVVYEAKSLPFLTEFCGCRIIGKMQTMPDETGFVKCTIRLEKCVESTAFERDQQK
jgi:hypothetical protein